MPIEQGDACPVRVTAVAKEAFTAYL